MPGSAVAGAQLGQWELRDTNNFKTCMTGLSKTSSHKMLLQLTGRLVFGPEVWHRELRGVTLYPHEELLKHKRQP